MATLTDQTAPTVDTAMAPARRPRRWFVLAGLMVVVLVAVGLVLRPAPQTPFNGGSIEPAAELPTFELQRAGGGRFSTADTRGRISLFFFGYTTCPDVCPMTLAQMNQVRRLLSDDAAKVDVYFITVDPERDTPERLAAYTAAFDRGIVGLTGTHEELARAMAPFGAVAQRRDVPASAVGYLVDHSATITLVDQTSRVRLIYAPQSTPAEIAADIQQMLAHPAR